MIFQQIIEKVQKVLPGLKKTEIALGLNDAMDDFCLRTRVLRGVSAGVEYSAGDLYKDLPSTVIEINYITMDGTTETGIPRLIGTPTSIEGQLATSSFDDHMWWLNEDGQCGIGIVPSLTDSLVYLTDATMTAYFHGVKYATHYTSASLMNVVPDIPAEYHRALVYHIISENHSDPKMTLFYDQKYERVLANARITAANRKLGNVKTMKLPDYFRSKR